MCLKSLLPENQYLRNLSLILRQSSNLLIFQFVQI